MFVITICYSYVFSFIIFYFQSDKELLYDSVKNELEEKIRRLEEDRHNIDISSGRFLFKFM